MCLCVLYGLLCDDLWFVFFVFVFLFLCLCVSVLSCLNNVFVWFCDSPHDLAFFVFVVLV